MHATFINIKHQAQQRDIPQRKMPTDTPNGEGRKRNFTGTSVADSTKLYEHVLTYGQDNNVE